MPLTSSSVHPASRAAFQAPEYPASAVATSACARSRNAVTSASAACTSRRPAPAASTASAGFLPAGLRHPQLAGGAHQGVGQRLPGNLLRAPPGAASIGHRVRRVSWRAQGTCATTTPCSGQDTRGASASTNARNSPSSSARHRRRPSPRSYPGHGRRQIPHRLLDRRRGRTCATSISSSSSNSTRSTTVFSTPSRAGHTVVLRTPFSDHIGFGPFDSPEPMGGRRVARSAGQTPPTETTEEPRFSCPVDGCGQKACPVHDAEDRQWRHLDFFQHEAYMHARLPRVRCHEHGVHQVNVSWARPGSGFTLLFEALLITFATAMPVAKVGEIAREHDTRVWRVIENHVARERAKLDFAEVREVGLDETSAAKGQDYITVFMDLLWRRVLFAIEGRDGSTVKAFAADLVAHGGDPELITRTSSDMSNAFIAGVGDNLPNAEMTFDRFHIMKLLSEAVDDVRRVEQRDNPLLKKTRYIWLKNETNLTAKQKETRAWLTRPSMRLATARALRWREDFQAFYDQPQQAAEAYLRHWCYGAKRSRLEPLKEFVKSVEEHWDGIISWHASRISNGLLEGTDSLIQAAKARARGYRSKRKMIAITYLIAGKLPTPSPFVTHTM